MISLLVNGVGIVVSLDQKEMGEALRSDYAYFIVPSPAPLSWQITVSSEKNFSENWWPALRTKRSTIYWSRPGIRRVRFFGDTWVECDFHKKTASIYFNAFDLGYESLYFTLESILTLELDRKRCHRVHGLGAVIEQRPIAVLGSSGSGKSSLFAEWFHDPSHQFLGDDLLVTNDSRALAYPVKISFKQMPTEFPADRVRIFPRYHFGVRYLVDVESLISRFTPEAPWLYLVRLERKKGGEGLLLPAGRLLTFGWLIRWLVLGLETPQIAEFFLPFSPQFIIEKIGHLFSRVRRAWKISGLARGFVFQAPEGKALMAQTLKHALLREWRGKPRPVNSLTHQHGTP